MNLATNSHYSASYFSPGMIVAYGSSIDTSPHKHALLQLCLPSAQSYLNGEVLTHAKVIKPNELHQLSMPKGWIVLAEPQSELGNIINELPLDLILPMMNDDGRLDGLFKQLHLLPTLVSALKTNPYQCTNKRILKLLDKLDTCTTGKCLKPDKWRAKDIAQWLSISESRFLHMVREELGVAWRPYLLWRRLLCAIQAIKNGQSITNAAYIAGFSDSAHLCRTIKRLFGMTSKQLINSFN